MELQGNRSAALHPMFLPVHCYAALLGAISVVVSAMTFAFCITLEPRTRPSGTSLLTMHLYLKIGPGELVSSCL